MRGQLRLGLTQRCETAKPQVRDFANSPARDTVPPMGTVISLVSTKGGSGKSTLAVHLAAEWLRQGHSVAFIDCDPQQSAGKWVARCQQAGAAMPDLIPAVDENTVARVITEARDRYDVVVCDTAGRSDPRAVYAAGCADLVLCPMLLHAFDAWARDTTLGILRNVQAIRPNLRGAIVANQASDERTKVGRAALAALESVEDVPLCPVRVGRRIGFAEAVLAGQGVTTHAPSSDAARDIRALADWCIAPAEAAHGVA